MIERVRHDVDDLAQRQRIGVTAVVDLTGCGVGAIGSEQNGVRDVFGITAVMQRQPTVGQHDVRAPIAYPSNDAPLARHELIRSVDERIAEVRCGRMGFEHDAFGTEHTVTLLVFGSVDRLGPIFIDGNRQSMRRQHTGIGVPRYAGTPPIEMNRPVLPRMTSHVLRNRPYAAIVRSKERPVSAASRATPSNGSV
jgi:hypothetical protein